MQKIYPKGVKAQVQRLNALTTGPSAVRLPRVKRLDLQFQQYVPSSSVGAKMFWRTSLSPIQYYNPQLIISVRRYVENKPPTLTCEFESGQRQVLNIADKSQDEILQELIEHTGAEQIPENEQVRLRLETRFQDS